MRFFYALSLPEKTLDALDELNARIKEKILKGRVAPRENLHLTLSFVGFAAPSRTEILMDILTRTATENKPCRLSLSEPTTLSGAGILCTKVKPDENLIKLHNDLTQMLNNDGFTVETRYTPHITLVRHPCFYTPFAQLKKEFGFLPEAFEANEIVLYESVTEQGKPPRYIALEKALLKP